MLRRAVSRKFGGADVGHIDKTAFHVALNKKITPKSHVQTHFYADAVTRKVVFVVAFVLQQFCICFGHHRAETNAFGKVDFNVFELNFAQIGDFIVAIDFKIQII